MLFRVVVLLSILFFVKYLANNQLSFKQAIEKKLKLNICFFHPYCDSLGGGERVLWTIIITLAKLNPNFTFVIYSKRTNQRLESAQILGRASETFDLPSLCSELLQNRVRFVSLRSGFLLESKYYPRFTLLLQSLASQIVAIEAFLKSRQDVYIESTGFAFTLPIFSVLMSYFSKSGLKLLISYVHYPTISLDMLSKVSSRKEDYNNSSFISSSAIFTQIKLIYYHAFKLMYFCCGQFSSLTIVNSTWTKKHIDSIWKTNSLIIYPPCNVNLKLDKSLKRERRIISVGQFRPEKNHSAQIKVFNRLLPLCKQHSIKIPNFVIIGGCRGVDDELRVEKLKSEVKTLNLESFIKFEINLSSTDLVNYLKTSLIGLHTMENEHFGIAPVEMQSHGLVVIAHKSGGPEMDIINHKVSGYLAENIEQYADFMLEILQKSSLDLDKIRENGFKSSQRFSTSHFEEKLKSTFLEL